MISFNYCVNPKRELMAKEDDSAIEVTGTVIKVLPATMYKVQLDYDDVDQVHLPRLRGPRRYTMVPSPGSAYGK